MCRRVLMGLALAIAGCTSMQQRFDIRRQDVSCDQANRYAFQSVRSLGYEAALFEPAAVGREGVVRGTRRDTRPGGGGSTDTGVVRIRCEPGEVLLTAREDRFLSQDLTFPRGFYLAFTGLVEHAGASKAWAEEQSGGVAGGGVKFKIQPQHGLESKLDFGEDLAAGGVLAVKVTIQNGSDRTYELDPASIELRPAEGQAKIVQTPVATAAAGVARAAAADAGEGAPPPDPKRIEAILRERALAARTLKPGEQVEGFLYFPVGNYARARATLIDVETKEGEGFLVEF